MRSLRLLPGELDARRIAGRVLTHDVAGLRKGRILAAADLPALQAAPEIHLAELEAGDVHEDQAAVRLGAAISGAGVRAEPPALSQVPLVAEHRGVARVARGVLGRLNRLPAVGVFTVVDGQAVEAGEQVAGAKVTPVAVPGEVLARAEALGPAVRVDPFRPLRTLVVVTERLRPRARELFAEAATRKLGWYGSQLLGIRQVARNARAVSEVYREAGGLGAELVLFAGASSIDPLDAAYSELERAGGRVLRRGTPAHPGSMLWLGRLRGATVLGVASCAGFGRNTSLDLVLPVVFARGGLAAADLARLGHGGLIEEGAGRRFPPYPRSARPGGREPAGSGPR